MAAGRRQARPEALSGERRLGTADRWRWTADRSRCTGALRAARGDPCHHRRL